jgi:hypothetical protein
MSQMIRALEWEATASTLRSMSFPVIARPKTRILAISTWALDLLWIPMFLGGRPPFDHIAAVGFLCTSLVGVIAHSVYHRRKAAGLYNDLTPLPWNKQAW